MRLELARVVSKTVVYVVLTAFVTLTYLAAALALQALLSGSSGSSVAFSLLATAVVAVLFQPVRRRIQRIADRVVYGQRTTPYEALAALSRRMRDPIAVEALLPSMARIVAEGTGATQAVVWLAFGDGLRPAAVWPGSTPLDAQATRTVPIHDEGDLLGTLTVVKPIGEPMTPVEDDLLSNLAAQAGLAMRNVRLVEELKASRQRILAAQDAERRRLERDIHDGAQQRLISLSLALRLAVRHRALSPAAVAQLETAAQHLQQCLVELRDLARGVHPVLLTEAGLGAALSSLAERSPIITKVVCVPETRLPAPVEATAYQVAQRALTAACRAGAASASISAHYAGGELVVEIADDISDSAAGVSARASAGLQDRVAALDGRIQVDAPAGGGVVVRVVIPCESC